MAAVKVLFDRNVRRHGEVEEHGFRSDVHRIHQREIRVLRPVTRKKPPRYDWQQNEIEQLPILANIIQNGRIKAFTTHELMAEGDRVSAYPSPKITDIFEGCEFHILPSPLDRSKWGLTVSEYLDREEVIDFCERTLLNVSSERIERFIDGMKKNPRYSLSAFEEKCLRRLHVFQGMCKGIHRTHLPDALHFWTAEENGVDVFLTLEKSFRNVIERKKMQLNCRIMFPSEFLSTFFS